MGDKFRLPARMPQEADVYSLKSEPQIAMETWRCSRRQECRTSSKQERQAICLRGSPMHAADGKTLKPAEAKVTSGVPDMGLQAVIILLALEFTLA